MCNPDCPRCHAIDQADLELIFCFSASQECTTHRPTRFYILSVGYFTKQFCETHHHCWCWVFWVGDLMCRPSCPETCHHDRFKLSWYVSVHCSYCTYCFGKNTLSSNSLFFSSFFGAKDGTQGLALAKCSVIESYSHPCTSLFPNKYTNSSVKRCLASLVTREM